MRYGSLFSGIGGFDFGFDKAGMTCYFQVENDYHCANVLDRHWWYPERHGDIRYVKELPDVDVICGGFPCQDVSVAGRREGLAGERSSLWFEFHRILEEYRPYWVVIENVPGLLSSNEGKDFKTILLGLVELRYGVCWRVLDSQYFGVPQRRRRVFIVGSLGNGRSAEILFESESRQGDFAPRQKKGKDLARPLGHGSGERGWRGDLDNTSYITGTLRGSGAGTSRPGGGGGDEEMYVFETRYARNDREAQGGKTDASPVVVHSRQDPIHEEDLSLPLEADAGHSVADRTGVRRLTPVECERLQGFPDGWTSGQSDAQRYRQLGNAVTVNVAEWIGSRLVRKGI